MTAEDTALSLLAGNPGAVYWPLTDDRAASARQLVADGKLVALDAAANEGRGTYRLNAPPWSLPDEPEKPS